MAHFCGEASQRAKKYHNKKKFTIYELLSKTSAGVANRH